MFDGVFEDLIKDKSNSDKGFNKIKVISNDKTPVKQVKKVKQNIKTLDPRPDLSEDNFFWKNTLFWQQMLAAAQDRDPTGELYDALHYMRTKGTVVRRLQSKDGKYVYVLRPHFDPTGKNGWANIKEYEAEKHKVLDPVRDRLIELLRDM